LRVVFFGTPEPAAAALDALLGSRHAVAAVVTQPDRPRGRSGTPQPPPVKVRALEAGLPVLQPGSPRDEGFATTLAGFAPDVCAVVAYGHILPADVLSVPPRGFVNVHFSLLPRYRGAAPVQRALMAGETETGVSTFLLEPTLDTGPVLIILREVIRDDDTAASLMDRLAEIGARALVETLDGLEAGTLHPSPQDPSEATPAPKVKPEEGEIDWRLPADRIVNLVRGTNPAPGAYTTLDGKRLKVWRARAADQPTQGAPGAVVHLGKGRTGVASGTGVVELVEVQLEGGKRLDVDAFTRGHPLKEGTVLGPGSRL
jgi:methionyl-tRNA formyltransferase